MKITYRPEQGPVREFIFRPGELSNLDAEKLENLGGDAWDTYEQFGRKFMNGNMRAYRAALWLCMQREQPRLKFQDLSFRVDQVDVDLESDEWERIRERIDEDENLTEDEREQLQALLDEGKTDQATKDIDLEEVIPEPVGKDQPAESLINST